MLCVFEYVFKEIEYRQSDCKPQKMECVQMYVIVLSFVFLNGDRHLIPGTSKKGTLTLKYVFKDMLLWEKGSAFVSTEDENLWIHYRLM